MRMKKMLAILATLSVLGTTGLTVGAEDVTTTEPATETVTTETEAVTTAAVAELEQISTEETKGTDTPTVGADDAEQTTGTEETTPTETQTEVATTTVTEVTTTTATTTTTVDPAETEEALQKIFEKYVAKKQATGNEVGGIKSFYYDAATKRAYGVYGGNGSMHSDVLCIITKDGVSEQNNITYYEDAYMFKESVYFTCNGTTFVAAIANLYSNGGALYALNIYNVNGNAPTRTNLYKICVGNIINTPGYPINVPGSTVNLSDYFTIKSDNVITVNGVDYTYDAESSQFVKVGSDSGKTDNGSASNAPATEGTSSTPKTGDTTTVPAVAVGLTLTAAGVVAFLNRKYK